MFFFFFFQAEDGIRDIGVTGVQTCALPISARAFAGQPVEYALRDPRSGRILVATGNPFYGPKIFYTDDPAGEWQQAEGVRSEERRVGKECRCGWSADH